MGTFVDSKSSARHKRVALESSQWEHVTFKAKISRTSDKVIYQVIIKHFGFYSYADIIKNWRVLMLDPETFGPNEMEGYSFNL